MTGSSLDLAVLEDRGDPVGAAELAAEAVRVLNRLTIAVPTPGYEGWEDVGDLYRVLVVVRVLVQRLPQVCDQLARHLCRDGVRYRSDSGTEDTPEDLVASAVDALGRSHDASVLVEEHLSVAQSAMAHLAPVEP